MGRSYCVGMPLIGLQNNDQLVGEVDDTTKTYKAKNKTEYVILDLDVDMKTFHTMNKSTGEVYENVELNNVSNITMPFFAQTIDSAQSGQVNEPFTIHECHSRMMDY